MTLRQRILWMMPKSWRRWFLTETWRDDVESAMRCQAIVDDPNELRLRISALSDDEIASLRYYVIKMRNPIVTSQE